MTYDTGYTSFFKISDEAVYGTAVAPTDDPLLLDSTGSIDEEQAVEEQYGVGSRKAVCTTYGNYAVSGSLTGKLQGGRLIAYALGVDTGSVATGLYTHTMTQNDTTALTSFTLDKAHINADKAQRVAGCKINDFSIDLDTSGQLSSTFNWVGKSVEPIISTVGTRSASTNCPFTSYMGTITWNSSSIDCKAFNFSYNNNIGADEYSIGDRRRKALPEGQIGMEGTFTLVFSDFTVYSDFQSTWSAGTEVGTERSLTFTADNGQSSTSERELTINMASVKLSAVGSAVELGEGRVVQEYTYKPKTLTNIIFKDTVSTDYISGDAIV